MTKKFPYTKVIIIEDCGKHVRWKEELHVVVSREENGAWLEVAVRIARDVEQS